MRKVLLKSVLLLFGLVGGSGIIISAQSNTHIATFSVNGETSSNVYAEGATITFPDNPSDINGKTFVGWVTTPIVGSTDSKPSFVSSATMGEADVTYYAVFATAEEGTAIVTDTLTTSTFGGPYPYTSWFGKRATNGSDAVYIGNSSTYGSSSIQLRGSDDSGIVTTTSGGKVKKITVSWNTNTTSGRTLDVYGKTTAYSDISNLYSTLSIYKGTKLGSIVYGTSTELEITGDYTFVGLRSNNGTMYLAEIDVDWEIEVTTYSAYCTNIPANVTIQPAYAKTTYVTPYAMDFSDITGLKAYVATAASSGTVTLSEVGSVPAETPLMLIGTAGSEYSVPVIVSAEAPASNMFKAGDGTTTFDSESTTSYDYILYSDGLFYRIQTGTSVTIGKAYLHCMSDPTAGTQAPGLRIVVEENNATNLQSIEDDVEVVRFIRNGQLLIKRDGIAYDALGRVVK